MEDVRGRRGVVAGGRRMGVPEVKEIVPSSGWTEDPNSHYLLVDLPDFKKEEVRLQLDSSGLITVSGQTSTNDNRYILNFKQTFKLPPNSDLDNITARFDGEILYLTVSKRVVETKKEIPKDVADDHINENANDADNVSTYQDSKHDSDSVSDGENGDELDRKYTRKKNSTSRDDGKDGGEEADMKERRRENGSPSKYDGENGGGFDGKKMRERYSKIDSFPKHLVEKWGKEPYGQMEKVVNMIKDNKEIVVTAVLAFSLGVYVTRKLGGTCSS